MSITIRHLDDLKSTRTPLTIISGVGEKLAEKLRTGGIITVMALSICDPKRLMPLGLNQSQAKKAVEAAQWLVDSVTEGKEVEIAAKSEVVPTQSVRTIMINGQEIEITPEDIANAETIGIPTEDYLLLDEDTAARELRIARNLVIVDGPAIDHNAEEFDLGTWGAPDFVKSRQKAEINAQHKRLTQRQEILENTASFVKDTVFGEDIDGSSQNVNPLTKNANMNPTQEELETEVYIPNRRQKETRLEAKKRQSDGVKHVIDNILS